MLLTKCYTLTSICSFARFSWLSENISTWSRLSREKIRFFPRWNWEFKMKLEKICRGFNFNMWQRIYCKIIRFKALREKKKLILYKRWIENLRANLCFSMFVMSQFIRRNMPNRSILQNYTSFHPPPHTILWTFFHTSSVLWSGNVNTLLIQRI